MHDETEHSEEYWQKLRDTPCKTRKELDAWLGFHLQVYLPNCVVDKEHSDCCPMDMVWMMYNSAINTQDVTNALFIGNRDGGKTFSAAVLEFLLLQHDSRSTTHVGAIEKQAKRAYSYFQEFYKKPRFKNFVDRMIMEKTVVKERGTFEVLPCTIASVNGPHTALLCVHNKSRILVNNIKRDISKQNRDRVLINASQLYNKFHSGLPVEAISFNHKLRKIESSKVLEAYNNGKKEIIRIIKDKGRDLLCSLGHKVYSVSKEKYVKACELQIGDIVFSTRKVSTNVNSNGKIKLCVDCYNEKHSDLRPVKIVDIKYEKESQVYDFTVEKNHNYFADNVLVHNCMDEVDVVQDLQAYKDISGIPTQMPDGRPPIKIGISTRKCVTGNCYATMRNGDVKKIKDLKIGDVVAGMDNYQTVVNQGSSGIQKCYRICLENSAFIEVSENHKNIVLGKNNQFKKIETINLKCGDYFIVADSQSNAKINLVKIVKIEDIGVQETYNIEVTGDHSYLCNNILTSNSSFGLVQQEVDGAAKTGLKVFKWGILEVTRRCPDSRSGIKRQDLYINIDRLETLQEDDWSILPHKIKNEYTKYEMYEHCTTQCKMSSACRGMLKNQTCNSPYLREIDFAQKQIFEAGEDWTNAQHLCRKPSSRGLVYSNFSVPRSVKSYKEMIEIFLGHQLEGNIMVTEEDLVKVFEGHGLRAMLGIDFGFTDPYVVELMYVDGQENAYIIREFAVTGMDGAEVALYLQKNWAIKYKIEIAYPDIESPANIKLLRKPQEEGLQGITCAGALKDEDAKGAQGSRYVNKDVKGGIETVRRFIKVPGKNKTRLYVHSSCELLLDEIKMYHYKTDKFGNVISDNPEDSDNHACFIGDTLIRMANGSNKKIKDVVSGDCVSTPIGSQKVINSQKTGMKEVYKACFSDGTIIFCTKDHPFFVDGCGFVELHRAQQLKRKVYKWNKPILSLKGKNIDGMAFTILLLVGVLKVVLDFMWQFGKRKMDWFSKDIIFIIKILILEITTLRILKSCWSKITSNYMLKGIKKIQIGYKEIKNICQKLDIRRKSGTDQKKALNGINNIGIKPLEALNRPTIFVRFVIKNIKVKLNRMKKVNFVRISAVLNIEGILVWMMLKRNVLFVKKYLGLINIEKLDFVHVNALHLISGHKEVYNLTIDKVGCFFANDILVSNCDAIRYILHSRYGHKNPTVQLDVAPTVQLDKPVVGALSVGDMALKLGLPFNDNEDEYKDKKEKSEMKEMVKTHLGIVLPDKTDEEEDDPNDDGFSFSF